MAEKGYVDPEKGKLIKAKKPEGFVGKIVVLSAEDRIGYQKGDIIDYVDGDQDLGNEVWDDPRFKIVYIKDVTSEGLDYMKEDYLDGTGKKVDGVRRKRRFNTDDITIKDKDVWEVTEAQSVEEERTVLVDQPARILVP